jgi:serine/threonine-protein kinase
MEYVKGEDLEALIRNRSLARAQFLDILAQVCDGLDHAHRNGIIHRDIKPANVRVIRDGENLLAKVMDFGVARMEDSSMTATGTVMGTLSYMAPEYIRTGRAQAQSDLFAVGVMLYEGLAGRRPFGGDTAGTLLYQILNEDPAPLDAALLAGLPESLRDVLGTALAKEPSERFQTARLLAMALRACLGQAPGTPEAAGGLQEDGTQALRPALVMIEPTRALRPEMARASEAQERPLRPGGLGKGRRWLLALPVFLLLVGGVAAYVMTRPRLLTVVSEPVGAKVSVDGVALGETPLKDLKLPKGAKVLELEKDGFLPVRRALEPADRDLVLQLAHVRTAASPGKEKTPEKRGKLRKWFDRTLKRW